jgi:hypothetical protein
MGSDPVGPAAALNEALVHTSALIGVLDSVRGYCAANLGLDLTEPA